VRSLLALVLVACSSPGPGPSATPHPAPGPSPAPAPAPSAADGGEPTTSTSTSTSTSTFVGSPDDLVDVAELEPGIAIEMRYATADNFTGRPVYPVARCLLRRAVAERLARVQARLAADGRGLKVWDCYRPFHVQEDFWKRVPDARYVAKPVRRRGVPVSGSKHNRGAAVDLTLVDAAGAELEMPTSYDDFSARAHRGHASWSATARANAVALEAAMVAEGFEPLPTEWWHFDAAGWQAYPLADQPLDQPAPAR
jgi:zinc D-Ala-D-Ala dipeptidase